MLIISIGWLLVEATVTVLASVLLFISYISFVYIYIFVYQYLRNLYVQVLVKAREKSFSKKK